MTELYDEFKKLGGGDSKACPCKYKWPRRLYIREGGRGKQKFVPWGITCIHCGFVRSKQPIRVSKNQIAWEFACEKFHVENMSNEESRSFYYRWNEKTREEQIKLLLADEPQQKVKVKREGSEK